MLESRDLDAFEPSNCGWLRLESAEGHLREFAIAEIQRLLEVLIKADIGRYDDSVVANALARAAKAFAAQRLGDPERLLLMANAWREGYGAVAEIRLKQLHWLNGQLLQLVPWWVDCE